MNFELAYRIGMHQHRDEIEPFAHWIANRGPRNVVEIGTLHGGTAALWHSIATGLVISIDKPNRRFGGADHELTFKQCLARSERLERLLSHRFIGILADSQEESTKEVVEDLLGDELVDLLFIDGDHTYAGVLRDYELYLPLMAPGGVVAFHDINDTDFHHQAGCYVDQLWKSIQGTKREFTIKGEWGGIGALVI